MLPALLLAALFQAPVHAAALQALLLAAASLPQPVLPRLQALQQLATRHVLQLPLALLLASLLQALLHAAAPLPQPFLPLGAAVPLPLRPSTGKAGPFQGIFFR